jgi:hypothetical protein
VDRAYDAVMDATAVGRTLAERHVGESPGGAGERFDGSTVDPSRSLLNGPEVTGAGDWSLRSALCRLAQPEPMRVGRLLESVRRLDAALHHVRSRLERHPAVCIRPVTDGGDERHVDARTVDIARVAAAGGDLDAVVAGYGRAEGVEPLIDEELRALPILLVAVRLERLAAVLIEWADHPGIDRGPEDPPVDLFDQACAEIESRLDELGVPRETGPPPRGFRDRG